MNERFDAAVLRKTGSYYQASRRLYAAFQEANASILGTQLPLLHRKERSTKEAARARFALKNRPSKCPRTGYIDLVSQTCVSPCSYFDANSAMSSLLYRLLAFV